MSAPDVPEAVTYREIQEILRTFRDSGWTGMTVDLHGMRITVGKNGPPTVPVDDRRSGPDEGRIRPGTGPDGRSSSSAAAATAPAGPGAVPAGSAAAAAPAPAAPAAASPARPGDDVDLSGCVDVHSPAVGAFWVAPSPGRPPFVHVGQTVAQDEQLAIVEVMKLMNPVVAPVAGTVVQICAADAELVEYDQVLFRIRPGDG